MAHFSVMYSGSCFHSQRYTPDKVYMSPDCTSSGSMVSFDPLGAKSRRRYEAPLTAMTSNSFPTCFWSMCPRPSSLLLFVRLVLVGAVPAGQCRITEILAMRWDFLSGHKERISLRKATSVGSFHAPH